MEVFFIKRVGHKGYSHLPSTVFIIRGLGTITGCSPHGNRVDAGGIAIDSTRITYISTIASCPYIDGAFATATLQQNERIILFFAVPLTIHFRLFEGWIVGYIMCVQGPSCISSILGVAVVLRAKTWQDFGTRMGAGPDTMRPS